MAIKDVKTGEMIDITRDWLTEEKRTIFEAYPLTREYPPLLQSIHTSLSKTEQSKTDSLSEEERKKLSELLDELDDRFDSTARDVDIICKAFARAFPDKSQAYTKVRTVILPDGLSIINTSYRNEAGETERIVERLERNPDVRKTIDKTKLNDVPFSEWVDRLVDAGRRIGPLAARYDVPKSQREAVLAEFKERNRWTKMVTTLRRTIDLAEWTPEHIEAIFGQVDRLSAAREKSPAKPEQTPETSTTDTDESDETT